MIFAMRRRSATATRVWALAVHARRRRWRDRLLGREVGLGFPQVAAFYGFAAGVWSLPQAQDLEPRRSLLHALLSFVFNPGVLALTLTILVS